MTPKEKITIKTNWSMTDDPKRWNMTNYSDRVTIVKATYRQALTYLCSLRFHYGQADFATKPIFIGAR